MAITHWSLKNSVTALLHGNKNKTVNVFNQKPWHCWKDYHAIKGVDIGPWHVNGRWYESVYSVFDT